MIEKSVFVDEIFVLNIIEKVTEILFKIVYFM